MNRYLCIVEGRVQGVGFRYFAQSNAVKYQLTGYAKNLTNGMVEIQIQGKEENIQSFLSAISKGNYFIKVNNISSKKLPVDINENKFKIQY